MHKDTALLVIDVQVALFEVPGNPTYQEQALLTNIADLLTRARSTHTPIIYIQHQEKDGPLVSGSRGWQIHPVIAPREHEPIVHKRAPDAFLSTMLEDELRTRGISHLVITGCRTDFCVDTTSRSAISHGYDVTLVADGHSTINRVVLNADQIVAHHNATLNGFGSDEHVIIVKPTSEIVFSA